MRSQRLTSPRTPLKTKYDLKCYPLTQNTCNWSCNHTKNCQKHSIGHRPSGPAISRIYHRSLLQIEKSQPVGIRIMPETRFTEFRALSVDPRVGISFSASETDDSLFFLPPILKIIIYHSLFLLHRITAFPSLTGRAITNDK